MSKWDGLNRRKFPRARYPCLVVLRNGENEREIILTHTENVGIGGICVILKQNIPVFSPVELEIDLLDLGKHVQCQGKIVWNVRRKVDAMKKPLFYDIGVEFQDISSEDLERLTEIVGKLVKKQDEIPAN